MMLVINFLCLPYWNCKLIHSYIDNSNCKVLGVFITTTTFFCVLTMTKIGEELIGNLSLSTTYLTIQLSKQWGFCMFEMTL